MRKIYMLIALGLVIFGSCTKEEPAEDNKSKNTDLIAFFEQAQTKTVMNGLNIEWIADDAIKVWDAAGKYAKYTANKSGAKVAFTQSAIEKDQDFDSDAAGYAFYPFSAVTGYADGTVTFTIPETQTYATNSFGQNSNFAVARIEPINDVADEAKEVNFTNVGGVLELQLSVPDGQAAKVGRIVLTDNTKEICGTFTVDATAAKPSAVYSNNGGKTITLNCGEGVALSDDETAPTSFFITVPVGALAGGFTAEVYSNHDHLITTLKTTKDISILRATVNTMKNKTVNWLPDGFVEYDYLLSSRKQMIDTEFLPIDGYQVDVDFNILSSSACYLENNQFGNTVNPSVVGINTFTTTWEEAFIDWNASDCAFRLCYGPNSLRINKPVGGRHLVHAEFRASGKQVFIFDGARSEVTYTYPSGFPNLKVGVFGNYASDTRTPDRNIVSLSESKVYSLNLYGTDGSPVRQFIPAYVPDGVELHQYGLYDVLNGKFYTNAIPDTAESVEDFTAGNEEH